MARYQDFDRDQWAARRRAPARPVAAVGSVPAIDVVDVYGPLAELLADRGAALEPFVVAVTGSVAVGKSAAAAALATAFANDTPRGPVAVVCTDGFLYPNVELEARGLVARKGFPESFDHDALTKFLVAVREGADAVTAPVYSHVTYDIVPDARQVVARPSVLVLEGLPFPDEHVDHTIYLDAATADIEAWYVERFRALCADDTTPDSPFVQMFRHAPPDEVTAFARQVWSAVNLVNLEEHILPVRECSDVIIEKGPDHAVRRVRLRIGGSG